MASVEVPISSYIHLAPDNLNGPKPLSHEDALAELSELERRSVDDMTGDVYLRPAGEPIFTPRTSRRVFIIKPGSNKLTRMPHKHTWGEEVIAEARKHERAQNLIQPGWIRRIPVIDLDEDNSGEATSIPVYRVDAPLSRLIVVKEAGSLTDDIYFGDNGRPTTTIRELLEAQRRHK